MNRSSLWTRTAPAIALLVLGASCVAWCDPVKLIFQYRGGGARTETAKAWIAEFEKLHPEIQVEFVPSPDGYVDKTLAAWAAGSGPDVTELWGDFAQDYARNGALLDLRPFVKRDFTQADIQDFWPTAWKASFLAYGDRAGIQFRIPRYMITTVFYYNQDAFNNAGLTDPYTLDQAGQWDYNALRAAARKLTISDGAKTSQYGFTTNTKDYRRLASWVRAYGGDWFRPEDPHDFIGDQRQAITAISMLQDMIWQDHSTTPKFETKMFSNGQVGIMEEGNHAVMAKYTPAIGNKFAWNIAARPVGPFGRQSYSGDDGFAIAASSKHPNEAWEFVKFLTSTRGQEINAEHEGLAPVRRSAMPLYQKLNTDLHLDVHMTSMLDASLPPSDFITGDVAQIAGQLNGTLQAVLEKNQKPYAQAIAEVAPALEGLAKK